MINLIGWTEKNKLSTLSQLSSIDIYHIIKIQKTLTLKDLIKELPRRQKRKEESFLNQKMTKGKRGVTKKTIEIKQGEEDKFSIIF